jgi:cation:H+ antiporter
MKVFLFGERDIGLSYEKMGIMVKVFYAVGGNGMSFVISIFILIASLIAILFAAALFTNGIEWLGKKLNLSEGAVGSVLAAVGTALPETMIPIVAILSGHADSSHVGIGAILGAPFMLATLAFFVVGVSARVFKNRKQGSTLTVDHSIFRRDIRFFLIVFALAAAMAFVHLQWIRYIVAILLVVLYIVYVYHTVRDGKGVGETEIEPLVFAKKAEQPGIFPVVLQVVVALSLIVVGARFFIYSLTDVAQALNVSPLLLSLIISPVATELPEKFNSIFWMRDGKDTLAMGNITGAMVFQSSVVPALGIAFTSWELSMTALLSVVLALVSAAIVFYYARRHQRLNANVLIFSGSFYLVFVGYVILGSFLGWPVQ